MDFTEIANKLGLDWRMILFNSVNFLVFYFVLNKFVFGKVAKAIHDRQDKVAESLKYAEEIDQLKESVNAESEEIISKANAKANEIITDAQKKAEAVSEKIKAETQESVTAMKQKAEVELQNQKTNMFDELKRKTADVALIATEKIIKDNFDKKKDKEVIEQYLKTLEVDLKNAK